MSTAVPRFLSRSTRLRTKVAPVSDAVAPVPDVVGPVSDVRALVQDMLSSVAGAVVVLAQLPPDLYSFFAGHRRGAARSGRSGRRPPPWAVGSRSCVGGVAIAAGPAACGYLGPATRRCLGPAGDRRGDRGCTARCDCARSSVSGVRDDTGSGRCRLSDRCGVVFPACFRRTPATRFTVGAGRWRSARCRRAGDPYRCRGARRLPPSQAGFVVQAAGIARFAGPGPLGVVHSGSLIVVRPRALRVARPRASSGRFDKVA